MTSPSWFTNPQTGNDQADAQAVLSVFDLLDAISSPHRTDVFRMLAVRYERDLRKMAAEGPRPPS